MCNLYSMTSNQEAMRRLFKFSSMQLNLPSLPAIFPGHDAPVVRLTGQGERELVIVSWGFVLPQKDKAPKRVTNARADKLNQSPFWKGSFEERRCLVPASSFAEPKGKKPAVWHWFGMAGDEPRPLFAFAGLWRSWRGRLKDEFVEMDVMAIVTTTPNDVVKPIHPSRMPVIVDESDYDTWLTAAPVDAFKLARPYPAEKMRIVHKGETKDDAEAA
ncbi:MAG: SOS response-associated peptidase [Pseudomonadota bacterium]